jgi:hypothetical protein
VLAVADRPEMRRAAPQSFFAPIEAPGEQIPP